MDAKRLLRSRLLAARSARPAAEIRAAGEALATHGAAAWAGSRVVAAYAGVGTEPPTRPLLDLLRAAGATVVLPVVIGARLLWAPYDGWDALGPGPLGLLQPAGRHALDDVVTGADVVLVPALAVDVRGHRLGRGKGYYDRALAEVLPGRAVAIVFDDEVLDEVPVEPHDRRVAAALTPAGLRLLDG